ncbi:MAG TPA: glycosyltransferase family 39 protein, partial [Chthoniobacteraceae bacterium]|nr:glycosyltransferase family 39 protein [Chthoniobacteraceae bacterium]
MAREKNSATIWICIVLAVLTFAAYWHSGSSGFVNLDDDAYVEFQPMVNRGLRSAAIAWAFTGVHSTNWHPLTSLSLILDCTFFGVKPGPMHIENVVFHVLNTLLVFLVWRALSGKTWPPALVAALFALHPLHVESVAWISERKDVLSTFFWLLGMAAYLFYTRNQSLRRYLLLAACFLLALLSKPMAVTFPAALLLLDFWPLRRWPAKSWKALVLEKIPLFGLALAHAAVTFLVQHAAGAANFGRRFPLASRLGNALVSYARYLGKTFYPAHLSPMYWHPGYWPAWAVIASLLLLAALTWLAWHWRGTRPWLAFGWLWFLGTLLPVIGIIQVGAQSMADRYTYIPLLGIFTILACAGEDIATRFPKTRLPLSAAAGIFIAACFALTLRQVRTWHDSISLYKASIAAGEDNPAIRYLYALALQTT